MDSTATWVCSLCSHAVNLAREREKYARRSVMVVGSVGIGRNRNNEAIVVGRRDRYVLEMVVSLLNSLEASSTLAFLERAGPRQRKYIHVLEKT